MRFAVLVFVILAAGAVILAADASVASAVETPDRDRQARDLFVAGRYGEALNIYGGLYATTHHPTYLRNLGRCHQMLRQPEPALAHFHSYLREARDLGPQERAEIADYIAEMEALRAIQAPAPATGLVDRPGPALPVLNNQDTSVPLSRQWWFWTGVGVLIAGGIVTAIALGSRSGDRLACPPDTRCLP